MNTIRGYKMRKFFAWMGLCNAADDMTQAEKSNGTLEELRMASKKDHELYGTYFVIEPNTSMEKLVGIQDYLREHEHLTFINMRVAELQEKASKNGRAFMCIDEDGKVFAINVLDQHWRKITFTLRPKVSYYSVEPKTVEINGKHYDKSEVEALLATLESKEMS